MSDEDKEFEKDADYARKMQSDRRFMLKVKWGPIMGQRMWDAEQAEAEEKRMKKKESKENEIKEIKEKQIKTDKMLTKIAEEVANGKVFVYPTFQRNVLPVEETELEIEETKRKRSFLVYDTNLALTQTLGLVDRGNTVYYFLEYRTSYPKIEDYISGYGFAGLKKIADYAEAIQKADIVMFTDVGFGALADLLRASKRAVFGASKKGEMLEYDRTYMIKEFEKLDIQMPKSKIIQGVSALIKFIKNNEGSKKKFFVKLNRFRGNLETFSCRSAEEAAVIIAQAEFGPLGEILEFIVSEGCEGVEIGLDFFFNGKELIYPYHWGDEVKDTGTKGKWVKKSIWDEYFLDKIVDWMKKSNYQGPFSMEAIFDGSNMYCLDATSRLPYPMSAMYPRNIKNWDDLIAAVAKGENIEIKTERTYNVDTGVYTPYPKKWKVVHFKPEYLKNIGWRRVIKLNGEYWYVPADELVCDGTGVGNTFEEAMSMCEETVKSIDVVGSYDAIGIRDRFDTVLKQSKKLGLKW